MNDISQYGAVPDDRSIAGAPGGRSMDAVKAMQETMGV